jgi:hypothetical protein
VDINGQTRTVALTENQVDHITVAHQDPQGNFIDPQGKVIKPGRSGKFYDARLYLVPTTLTGRVTDAKGAGVKLAKVQMTGGRESPFTLSVDNPGEQDSDSTGYSLLYGSQQNKSGYFILSGLETFTSERKLTVIAEGYSSQEVSISSLKPGEINVIDFQLPSPISR